MPRCHGVSGSNSTAVSSDALEKNFSFTIETQPELLAHHLVQAGFTERAIDYLRRAGQRSIERSANAEAIGHLTRALELLQSRPDNPQRKRAAFPLEAMLSQAMIASYGYTARSTREILLRARALIDDSTDPLQKFAVLYGLWASHYTAGEPAKLRDAARSSWQRQNVPMTPPRCVLRTDWLAPPMSHWENLLRRCIISS